MISSKTKNCRVCGYLLRSDRDIGPTCDGECKESYKSLKALSALSAAIRTQRSPSFEPK